MKERKHYIKIKERGFGFIVIPKLKHFWKILISSTFLGTNIFDFL